MIEIVEPSKKAHTSLERGLRPEAELLLCCARTFMQPEHAERIKALLQEDIDWTYLIQTAHRHGTMPLLYWNLNTTCSEAVPKAILGQFRDYFHTNAQRNLFLTEELLLLLNLFAAHGISAIPFKGPVLAASAYGKLSLRQFCDLDILVHERDVPRALDLLISQRYQPPSQLHVVKEKPYVRFEQFMESAQHQGSYDLARADGKVFIELHWKLTPKHFPFPIDLERSWESLQPISLAGTIILNFVPEEMLLILCMHGTKDGWLQMKWICDVAELIRAHQRLDWERVVEQAGSLGSKRMLFLGLLLASNLLGTALPEEVLQRMQADSATKLLAAHVREQLFCEADEPPGDTYKYFLHLRVRERLKDKVHYFFHLMMTPTEKDWEFLPLPASVCSLYYLLRPIRLAGKYGRSLLSRLGF